MTEKEFEKYWMDKIKSEGKNFPSDFIALENCKEIANNNKVLTIGGEFFGSYEIVDVDGKIVAQVSDYAEAKYLVYASLSKPDKIFIPNDIETVKSAVKEYQTYLDELITKMREDFSAKFPESKNFNKVSNNIFNSLNLHRY